MKTFFLGVHMPTWLARTDVDLFLSRRRLEKRKTFPRARGSWALDSGGFTELSQFGEWLLSARDYVALVRRFSTEIGNLAWATIQDWMCEPVMIQKTGLTVKEHQDRTIRSYVELLDITNGHDIRWLPVLQGWCLGDYMEHLEAYAKAGIDLTAKPLVGVGSICRRQHTLRAGIILRYLQSSGVRTHAFGLKTTGLTDVAPFIDSADSMAWSFRARRDEFASKADRNDMSCALEWRDRLLSRIPLEVA
jgi:hypothetical protein